jgi:hypothetical protein
MKKLLMSLIAAAALLTGTASFASETSPKSVIHVVTLAWKKDATPEQIKGRHRRRARTACSVPGHHPRLDKGIKVQNPKGAEIAKTHVLVMEFADEPP